jgi:hypothetical protein
MEMKVSPVIPKRSEESASPQRKSRFLVAALLGMTGGGENRESATSIPHGYDSFVMR